MVDSDGAAAAVWDYRHDDHISKLAETWSAVGRSNGVGAAGQFASSQPRPTNAR